jgi:hypothetical protein
VRAQSRSVGSFASFSLNSNHDHPSAYRRDAKRASNSVAAVSRIIERLQALKAHACRDT